MAKIWQISDGRSYIVNGDPGTTITYTNSTSNGTAAGKPAASIPAGATSVTFISNGSEVEISQDTATIDQVFNAAAAGAGSSSGGSGSSGGVSFQIVTTLPDQGAAGVIYLVKVSETGDDKFEEWIWVDSAWESIGTTAVDPTTYAKLVGGNDFTGNQTVQGDVTVNGSLTVTGDSSGIVDNNYNLVETADSTITPQAGTWTRYTGSETALTIEEPAWTGAVDLAYLETTVPVTLTGVTWSPAAPILTGDGPFVYTLVHSREGEVLAGAYGYSTPTAEAIQEVVPMAWSAWTSPAEATKGSSVALGERAWAHGNNTTALGVNSGCYGGYSTSVGNATAVASTYTTAIGAYFYDGSTHIRTTSEAPQTVVVGNGAQILNGTDENETTVKSSNSVAIGTGAVCNNLDSVVIGANAKSENSAKSSSLRASVVVGARASGSGGGGNVAIGTGAVATGADTSIGFNAVGLGGFSVVVGSKAHNNGAPKTTVLGSNATITNTTAADGTVTKSDNSTVVGYSATASAPLALTLGAQFAETVDGQSVTNYCKTEGTGSITIGAGANTLNVTADDGTVMESSNSVTIGCKALNRGVDSVVIGAQAKNNNISKPGVAIGAGSKTQGSGENVSLGTDTIAGTGDTAIGFHAVASASSGVSIGQWAVNSAAAKGVVIGSTAKITNTTAADGTIIRSENTTVIGYGASASAPNAVVLGANASTAGDGTVLIGAGTSLAAGTGNLANAILIGRGAKSTGEYASNSICIGYKASVTGDAAAAIGSEASAGTAGYALGINAKAGTYSTAIGFGCVNRNNGTTSIKQTHVDYTTNTRTNYATQFYIMAAKSPLAVQYEDGEACMGYVVKNENTGELLAAGTQKLSVLFPNNSTFQPSVLGMDDEYVVPKVFYPADLDLPVEEPTEEPEDVTINIPEPEVEPYTPLPVYPLVETETNIPEPEPYTPLPVYPIVEPEIQEPTEDQ